ncbi:MAG: hypothetical protein D3923_06705, partial [Candidatus Electrothrix sp. AR3]|nr:hypothetical protein [Candidatus Electrothrix sp. AR3]
NAGTNQSVVQGDTACFDGGDSSDRNGDVVSYSWEISSKPEGSTATLDDSTAVAPCIATDLAGSYTVSLIVNDGVVDSASDAAEAAASSYSDAITETFQETVTTINTISPELFKKAKQQNKLTDKINAIMILTDQGNYTKAHRKIQQILNKLDGCAVSGTPDKKDLIQDCAAQDQIYPLVEKGIGHLDNMINAITETLHLHLQEMVTLVNALDSDVFKKHTGTNKMSDKFEDAIEPSDNGNYSKTIEKLQDVLRNTDGCTVSGTPDKKDWIQNCESQEQIYPLIMETIEYLESIM